MTILCTHLYALETMRKYFDKILDKTGLEGNSKVWLFIFLQILFSIGTAFMIETIKRLLLPINAKLREQSQKRDLTVYKGRDAAIDVTKGIFIIAMLVGHFRINSMFRSIIYSCHMIAFVFFSGYFYKKSHNIWKTFIHMLHAVFVPYIIFVLGDVLINYQTVCVTNIKTLLTKYLLSISFSQKICSEVPSIGPVYFILMLFVVRLVYLLVDHCIKSECHKSLIIIAISIGGMLLGKGGIWLPWSIDLACYALIFYLIGIYCRKYNLLSSVKNNHMVYFILSPIWVFMIYSGSMEIAMRNYGQYGLVILGSLAGVLLIYKLSVYISDELPILKEMLRFTGESSIVVIIVHTLLNGKIHNLVSYRFDSAYIPYLVSVVLLQIILAWVIKGGMYWSKHWLYSISPITKKIT